MFQTTMTYLTSITAPSDTWDEEELEPENMAALAALSSDDDEDDADDDEDEEEVTSPDEGLEAPTDATDTEEEATPEDVLEAEEADELAALDRLERELKQDELGSMDDLLADEDESL